MQINLRTSKESYARCMHIKLYDEIKLRMSIRKYLELDECKMQQQFDVISVSPFEEMRISYIDFPKGIPH